MSSPRFLASLLLPALVLFTAPSSFSQGSLTPPGAPAPSMKSLDQLDAKLERRVPIDSLAGDANYQHVINAPGSYYLRGNLVGVAARGGIRVAAGDVNLDLAGFALTGMPGSTIGISVDAGVRRVSIRRGTLGNWTTGIAGAGEASVAEVNLHDCSAGAINLGNSGSVRDAQVTDCATLGIQAGMVIDSVVRNITGAGAVDGIIARLVRGSRVEDVIAGAAATGITAEQAASCSVILVQGTAATGFSSFSVPATDATHCRAVNVNATSGASYGFRSFATTDHCTVRSIQGTDDSFGIYGETVSACDVEIVQTGATGGAFGINASTVTGGNVRYVSSTGDLATGIAATHVSDLRVFTVSGVNATGVASSSAHHVTVNQVTATNGNAAGINGTEVSGCRVQSLTATQSVAGIEGGSTGTITDCNVTNLAGSTAGNHSAFAIRGAVITGCSVQGLAANLSASSRAVTGNTIQNCTVAYISSTANSGVSGIAGVTVIGCSVNHVTNTTGLSSARGIGISASTLNATTVSHLERNTVVACTIGIEVFGANRIVGNLCRDNETTGIRSSSGSSTITDNHTEGGTLGYSISGAGNYVVRNVSVGDTTAFAISATSRYAPIVVGAGAGVAFDPLANIDL